MKLERIFEIVYAGLLGSFGFHTGAFLLSDHTELEKLAVAGIFLILMRLEFNGRN